jgi:hypothetical protein
VGKSSESFYDKIKKKHDPLNEYGDDAKGPLTPKFSLMSMEFSVNNEYFPIVKESSVKLAKKFLKEADNLLKTENEEKVLIEHL